MAYRHPPNLRTLLVRAQFKPKQQLSYKGNSQCLQVHCKTCRNIQPLKSFKSLGTGKVFQIKATANCKMANVVYVNECRKCKKPCVRETENALHIRMNGNQLDIKHRHLDKLVANHFNSKCHSLEDLSIFVIEQIHRGGELSQRERKLLDPDAPIAGPRGTKSQTKNH